MSRGIAWVEVVLLVPAVALIYSGSRFGLPALVGLGTACLAAVVGMHGLDMLLTKKAVFRAAGGIGYGVPREVFSGPAAQLWGLVFLVGAALLLVLAFAAAFVPGGMEAFWRVALGSHLGWGLALIGLGLFVAALGLIRIMAGTAGLDFGIPARAAGLLQRLGGAVVLLLGAGLVALGLWIALAPRTLAALARRLLGSIL
jgi:hypothetical protein